MQFLFGSTRAIRIDGAIINQVHETTKMNMELETDWKHMEFITFKGKQMSKAIRKLGPFHGDVFGHEMLLSLHGLEVGATDNCTHIFHYECVWGPKEG